MKILQHAPGRYIVEGSKGQAYHVKRYIIKSDNYDVALAAWACDCPGSIYGHECRHIKAVKAKIEASAGGDFGYAFWKGEIIAKNVYDSQE